MILSSAFLSQYGRVLAIAAALAAIGITATAKLNSALERAEQRGYERAQHEADAALAAREREIAAAEADQREISRAHDIHYQQVTRDLQTRIDALTRRNVDLGRLQVRANRSCPAPAGAAAAPAEPDGRAGAGGHDLQAESGVGRELVQFAGECEIYRRQVIELQGWISATR